MPEFMAREEHLRRKPDRGLVGGVCVGLADYLGIEPLLARALMLGVAAASGIGIVLYPLAWALIPASGRRPWSWRGELARGREAAAIAVLTVAALFALRRVGLWLGDSVVWPLVLASSGLALILRQVTGSDWLDSSAPGRLPARAHSTPAAPQAGHEPPRLPWRRWPAGVLGIVLVLGSALLVLRYRGILPLSGRALAEASVLLLALAIIVAPFLLGQARRLSRERMQRIRSEERSEMAAHLHDSVLQTLALIQRQADDPARVVGLARAQERELRDWLLARDGEFGDPVSLRAGLERAAQEVEALHAVRVETVVVGDCPLDSRLTGLVAAAREALTNAAKFAGVSQVDLYAEAGEERVELFVRDRGVGFDPAQVPADRQGIRRSIRERMDRHGGQAFVRSAPGEGTEVELAMQRSRG
jgi:signal transduction histidine kinase